MNNIDNCRPIDEIMTKLTLILN